MLNIRTQGVLSSSHNLLEVLPSAKVVDVVDLTHALHSRPNAFLAGRWLPVVGSDKNVITFDRPAHKEFILIFVEESIQCRVIATWVIVPSPTMMPV